MLKTSFRTKGNVLFIILIAVALFAALTAAVTQSNRGGGNMDREKGTIGASEIMGYAANMEKVVGRMLANEMSEGGLSFQNTVWKLYDTTDSEPAASFTNCTSDECRVFSPSGGGLSAETFGTVSVSSPVATDTQSGHGRVYSLKVSGVGSTAHDLVLLIATISQATCVEINNQLGIANPSNVPPADVWSGAVPYFGTFSGPGDGSDEIGDVATGLNGKSAGCVNRTGGYGSEDNYFYQVLLPR